MSRASFLSLGLALALSACGAEAAEPASEPIEATEPEAAGDTEEAAEAEEAEPEITAEDLALPEDFEDEVAEEINADNLEDELAALEAELAEP